MPSMRSEHVFVDENILAVTVLLRFWEEFVGRS